MAKLKNVVGPQVRKLRDQQGWSQATLATKCQLAGWDISRSIVAAIEGRIRWVGDFELMMLAKVLHVSPSDLLPKQLHWAELTGRA